MATLSSQTSVRVATFNVLSSALGTPEYYPRSNKKHLDPRARLRRVIRDLDIEIEQHAVICLQEVSGWWSSELHAHLCERGYYMVHDRYGNRFDGHIGVAIAFPLSKFKLKQCRSEQVSDLVRVKHVSAPLEAPRAWRPLRSLRRLLCSVLTNAPHTADDTPPRARTKPDSEEQGEEEEEEEVSRLVRNRRNRVLSMQLSCAGGGSSFWIATYHAPCLYWQPAAMVVHVGSALQHLQRLARGGALVLCGDLNVQPAQPAYRLITEGSLHTSLSLGSLLLPTLRYGMKSAYKEANGQEPELTNWTFTRGSSAEFRACLDYILLSPDIQVASVKPLAALPPGPWPTRLNPSDHALIAATLLLPTHAENATAGAEDGNAKKAEAAGREGEGHCTGRVSDGDRDKARS